MGVSPALESSSGRRSPSTKTWLKNFPYLSFRAAQAPTDPSSKRSSIRKLVDCTVASPPAPLALGTVKYVGEDLREPWFVYEAATMYTLVNLLLEDIVIRAKP